MEISKVSLSQSIPVSNNKSLLLSKPCYDSVSFSSNTNNEVEANTMTEFVKTWIANFKTSLAKVEYKQVRASHILVKTQEKALEIKHKIENGASFEDMAKEYSKCPSKRNGGDLDYFKKGDMVAEFEKVAFELENGRVSEPVQTQFGWHLIKVTDKK